MQHELQYSLKTHLERKLGVPVVWIYDGVSLPATKPFITIEQMQNNNDILSKLRESIQTTYRFQIGIYANNSTQRPKLQAQAVNAINYDTMTLYQTDTPPATAVGFFNAFVTNVTPVTAESTDEKTKHHRVYLDVEIDHVAHKTKV